VLLAGLPVTVPGETVNRLCASGMSAVASASRAIKLGVPRPSERVFFGDNQAAADYAAALDRLGSLGADISEIDIEPFYEAARLLYEGPWVAERYAATETLIASSPDAMHPVTREIIMGGTRPSAVAAFKAFYRLEELRRAAEHAFRRIEVLALPTAPTLYTIDQVLGDPIQLNSRLGTYTNFVNLLDLCGLAVPAALHGARPFGITLLAPSGADALLASIGRVFHADTALPLGALGLPQGALAPLLRTEPDGAIALAVVGAHLSGMPLNGELKQHGARFVEATMTAAQYRLYALTEPGARKPGLLRVAQGRGVEIAVEIWTMPPDGFGRFVAAVPAPLSIGSVQLADGRIVKGFLVEAEAVSGARDISAFGGWRAFVAAAE